jgi:hypothetical protein
MTKPIEPDPEPWDEVLERLQPILERLFKLYGLSERQAEEIVEEACRVLVGKRLRRQSPELSLFHVVLERCERLKEEEEERLEDSPS